MTRPLRTNSPRARRGTGAVGSTTARRRTTRSGTRRSGATRRPRASAAYRRRARLATALGAALGILAVAALLQGSWPVRVGLALAAALVVAGWLLWPRREDDEQTTTPQNPTSEDQP